MASPSDFSLIKDPTSFRNKLAPSTRRSALRSCVERPITPKLRGCGVDSDPGVDGDDLLTEDGLPSYNFVERLVIGGEETAFWRTSCPVIGIIAKRKMNGVEQYFVLMATYEVSWRATSTLLPTYRALVREFEDTRRKMLGLPELRRSARLAESNVAVDDDELLF
ncbi:unnamed protein product [Phytophthora fragariaefolia]|uniref:Unnamed protein product n=1 Tax=Phytophthora fragariaefolia TaxID=1490495 RepID=A0A9W6U197_9STRA|nr:unnamed protein product [Phytophthora fragariaefolia]